MERCPICNVPVRRENLIRHVDENHPRHPAAAETKEKLRADVQYSPRKRAADGIQIRKVHVAIVLGIALLVGVAYVAAPYFDPYRNFTRDTCITSEAYHIHPYLRISIRGIYETIPTDIGIVRNPGGSVACTKPLHTHSPSDATGYVQIHVEGPVPKDFTVGDFFAVWGEAFTETRILSFVDDGTNRVTMLVDTVQSGLYGSLPLADGQRIEIVYGPTS